MGRWAHGGIYVGVPTLPGGCEASAVSVRRSIGSMMVATFVSRGLGFVKTMLLVAAIGATSAYAGGQAFETANTAPTYLFALIAGGVLGAVLVPQIVRNLDAGPVGRENTDRLLTVVLVGGAAATLLLTLCAPAIVGIYTVGWSDEWRTLATSMAYWCLPQVFFLIAFAVLSQMLNARGVFGAPAWAPAASNLIGIAGILVFLLALPSGLDDAASWSPLMIAVLAGSATLAIAVQALLLIIPLRRIGFRMRFRWGFGGLGQMSTLAGWTLLGVVAGQAAYLVTANVANNAGQTLYGLHVEGASLNSLSTAYLLVLLPHGIVTVSLTTALYTRMSGLAGRNDLAETDKLSSVATRPVAYVSIAAAALFVAVGPLLTQLIFSSAAVGHVLAVLSLGLVGFSQAYVLNRTSFALQDARGPFCTQLVIAGLSAAGSAAALLPPRSSPCSASRRASPSPTSPAGSPLTSRSDGHSGCAATCPRDVRTRPCTTCAFSPPPRSAPGPGRSCSRSSALRLASSPGPRCLRGRVPGSPAFSRVLPGCSAIAAGTASAGGETTPEPAGSRRRARAFRPGNGPRCGPRPSSPRGRVRTCAPRAR